MIADEPTFKMYGGDKARTPDLPPNVTAGEGITYRIGTARECHDIFQKCLTEGRFPGENAQFHSFNSRDAVLLEVMHECLSMQSIIVHHVSDGYLMIGDDDWVVGFVYTATDADYDAGVTAFKYNHFGVAYIGG